MRISSQTMQRLASLTFPSFPFLSVVGILHITNGQLVSQSVYVVGINFIYSSHFGPFHVVVIGYLFAYNVAFCALL